MYKEKGSGSKCTLGETESQMPMYNTRKHNNLMAGKHSYANGNAEQGYTKEGGMAPAGGSSSNKIRR